MSPLWGRNRPAPEERPPELDVAIQANAMAREDAAATRDRVRSVARKVANVHAVLMREGAENGFTKRWERAYREAM